MLSEVLPSRKKVRLRSFLSFEELFANIQAISIFKRAIVVSEVRLTKPFARIIREEDGSYNFNDLMEEAAAEKGPPPTKKSQPLQFSINNINIFNGSIDFLDAPKEVFHEITDMNLAVPFISNIRYHVEKTYVQPRFSALVNGDSFTIEGKTKPFADSLETEFDINIHDLDLADYLGYVPAHKKFKLLSGALDLTGKLSYVQYEDKGPDLVLTGKMTLRDIDLADESSKSLWKVNKTEFEIASLKPFEASIHLSRVDIQSPEINMRRNKDGTIDVFTLMGLLAGTKGQQKKQKHLQRAKTRSRCHFSSTLGKQRMERCGFRISCPTSLSRLNSRMPSWRAGASLLRREARAIYSFPSSWGKQAR